MEDTIDLNKPKGEEPPAAEEIKQPEPPKKEEVAEPPKVIEATGLLASLNTMPSATAGVNLEEEYDEESESD